MRVYSAPIEALSVTTSGDLWQIAPATNKKIQLLKWEITSSATTAEALSLKVCRAGTAGSSGTALDENPHDPEDSAATATATALNGTAASSLTDFWFYSWEQLGPVGDVATPETTLYAGSGQAIVCVLTTSPTTFTMNGYITWREL